MPYHVLTDAEIRLAVLEGDIDKALHLTETDYPNVLERNEPVLFRLKCRKFIELIRKEAELNIVNGNNGNSKGSGMSTEANGDGASHTNGHGSTEQNLSMDVDDIMMVEDGTGGRPGSHGADQSLAENQTATSALVNEALQYGQNLQAEFQSEYRPDIEKTLNEIFSLMAYANPLKQPHLAHLLDQRGRVAVAEELNAAILESLGKSSRSALENIYAQTSVLLEDLRQDGGPGSFVTIQSMLDEIPSSYSS